MNSNGSPAHISVTTNFGHGTTHRKTIGRTYTFRGYASVNRLDQYGKADCGAIMSGAARVTDGPVTCPKCLAQVSA